MRRLRYLTAALLLALTLAACIGATPSATPAESAFAQRTQHIPTVTSSPKPGPTTMPNGIPSPTPYDPILEAALPIEIGGVATSRWSAPASNATGGDMCMIWVCPGEVSAFIGALGDVGRDLRVGVAVGNIPVMVIGFRAPGVSGRSLFETWINALKPKTMDRVSVSGKTMTFAMYSVFPAPNASEYLYASGDVLYSVRFEPSPDWPEALPPPTPPEVTAAVEALP